MDGPDHSLVSHLPLTLSTRFGKPSTRARATRRMVLKLLHEVTRAVPGCTLILDGLDECTWMGHGPSTTSGSVTDFLEAFTQALADSGARVLLVSRDEPEIRGAIRGVKNHTEIHVSLEEVQGDVARYARTIVEKKLAKKNDAVKRDVSQRMADRCEGQFLWLKLQEGSLRSSKNKLELMAVIDETPPGVEHVYERNWSRIRKYSDRDRSRAMSLLRWAAFSLRPLTVSETIEAVLIDERSVDFPAHRLPDTIDEEYIDDEILGLCGSLVEVRSASTTTSVGARTIHLTHFSVKQFFLSNIPRTGRRHARRTTEWCNLMKRGKVLHLRRCVSII